MEEIRKFFWKFANFFGNSQIFSPKNDLVVPILRLLNSPNVEVNLAAILPNLPNDWSYGPMAKFIRRSVGQMSEEAENSAFLRQIFKIKSQRIKSDLDERRKNPVLIDDRKKCPICRERFSTSAEAIFFPNGILVHQKCSTFPYICPISGEIFRFFAAPEDGGAGGGQKKEGPIDPKKGPLTTQGRAH